MTTSTRLEDWGSALWDALPAAPEVSEVVFSSRTLPEPSELLTSDKLVIRRGFHDYGSYRADYPQWYADKETYGRLGLLILAAVFHPRGADVRVSLMHKESEIDQLVLRGDNPAYVYGLPELKIAPLEYAYCPSQPRRHPWVLDDIHPDDLPFFDLTNHQEIAVTDEERAARNVLRGLGSVVGAVRFGSLLLDISRPENTVTELALEGDAGFRGVARASAEVRLWLPGADGFVDWNPA